MAEKKEKDWKRTVTRCLGELKEQGIVPVDIDEFTGNVTLDINLNQGGVTDLDVSLRRKYR